MTQDVNHDVLPKKAFSHALKNPQILEWYTSDQEFKKKVDSLMNGLMTQEDLQPILKDSKMVKFFHFAGLTDKGKIPDQRKVNNQTNHSKIIPPNLNKQELEKKKSEAEENKKQGTEFYKNKEYKKALEYYQKASKLFPEEPSYILNQAAVYFMENKFNECERICQKVLNISRENQADYKWPAKAYTRLASIEEKRGDLKKAIQYLVESLTEFKDDKVKEKLRQLKKKLKSQEDKKQLNPEEALKLKIKGDEAFRSMKWKDAINLYTRSIKRNPNDPKVYNNCSTAYCKLMAWGPALDDASKAIVLDPKWITPYLRKAKIEQACKTYHKALMTLKLAGSNIENPKDPLLQRAIHELNVTISIANQKNDPERQQRALEDPQIQIIMQDPIISALLKAAQTDPTRIQKAMTNEVVREKIELLAAAGIIR
jgi:stress-induced-phosphoprotein 1